MLFIAEIGLNHNGNFSLAYEMIRQVKAAGADIAKFQLGCRDQASQESRCDCSPSAVCGLNAPGADLFHLRRVMVGFLGMPFPFASDDRPSAGN